MKGPDPPAITDAPPSDLDTTRSGEAVAVTVVWPVAVTPSVPSWAVTMMVKESPMGGVQANRYGLLPGVEATTLVSVNVVESTVPPEEFLITTSALVLSAAPNGSLTVKRTNAGWPAGVVVIGEPPGKA